MYTNAANQMSNNNIFSENTIQSNMNSSTGPATGIINLQNNADPADMSHNTFANNHILGSGVEDYGIRIEGDSSGTTTNDILIEGNEIQNLGAGGVGISFSSGYAGMMSQLQILNNRIFGTAATPITAGIQFNNYMSGVFGTARVEGNSFYEMSNLGIFFTGGSGTYSLGCNTFDTTVLDPGSVYYSGGSTVLFECMDLQNSVSVSPAATVTSSTVANGTFSGSFTAGTSGSSTTFTLTLPVTPLLYNAGTSTGHNWNCVGADVTTHTIMPMSATTGTTCAFTGTVANTSDLISFTAIPY